jgi:hypothetical protein
MNIAAFDPARALTTLVSYRVNFVTVGGLAALTWGTDTRMMPVLEICCERSTSNDQALADALNDLEASVRGTLPDDAAKLNIAAIETHDVLRLNTKFGAIDCISTPSGTHGYSDLIRNAVDVDLGDGLIVHVASLDDLLRIARTGYAPYDKVNFEILSAVKEEREKR